MLTIEIDLPVAIHAASSFTELTALEADSNLRILRSLNVAGRGSRSDRIDHPGLESSAELPRLEAKIDLLLSLVGTLLAQNVDLPAPRAARLSATTISLEPDHACDPEHAYVVALYLSPELPRAVCLPSRVLDRADGVVTFGFDIADASLREELERFVFLRHRQLLAGSAKK